MTGSLASTLGEYNPLRYRSYVYDTETGFYYLQSRYYDPEIGRFINADIYTSTGQGLLGNNMFAYCGNHPVYRVDENGKFFTLLGAVTGFIGGAVSAQVGNLFFGAENDIINCGIDGAISSASCFPFVDGKEIKI